MNDKDFDALMSDINEVLRENTIREMNEVIDFLTLKYGQEFVPIAVGGRIDSEKTVFSVSPKDALKPVFRAEYSDNGITDNYCQRLVFLNTENRIEENFAEKDISVCSKVFPVSQQAPNVLDVDSDPQSYIKKNGVSDLLIYLAIDGRCVISSAAEVAVDVFLKLSKEYETNIVIAGCIIGERFGECCEDMTRFPDFGYSIFGHYMPVAEWHFAVIDGVCNVSANSLTRTQNEG